MKTNRLIDRILSNFIILVCKKIRVHSLIQQQQTSVCAEPSINVQYELRELKKELIRHQTYLRCNTLDDIRNYTAMNNGALHCSLCGYKNKEDFFKIFQSSCIFLGGDLIRHQCPDYDLIFGDQKMLSVSSQSLTNDYEWHYGVYSEGDSTEQETRAFHLLSPRKNGVYLNFGSGDWYSSVKKLRDDGWNVFAYEPHASANSSNHDFVVSSETDLMKMEFDGIYSNNVLEHLRHPIDDYKLLCSLLTENGKMSHATPCFEYLYEYTRFHLFFYLGRSRELLADKSGLVIESFIQDGDFMCTVYGRKF